MTFYTTQEHIRREIEKKERELQNLRFQLHGAEVREFYWFMENEVSHEMSNEFLSSTWKISFMGKTVELDNLSVTFEGMENLLTTYMDDQGVGYEEEEDDDE